MKQGDYLLQHQYHILNCHLQPPITVRLRRPQSHQGFSDKTYNDKMYNDKTYNDKTSNDKTSKYKI
jgi:hypothetical protein